jgi:hypothetical protein
MRLVIDQEQCHNRQDSSAEYRQHDPCN